ncbi:MAG: hypothetical protein JW729_02080 [Bacteroidales bacterium]|nr:hypothetical protein [Bacteroidales bacterium]
MKRIKLFILTLAIFSFPFLSKSQTNAKEIQAEVYVPVIQIDELSSKVDETSGLLFFRNAVWTINDSGGKAEIYRLDENGKVVQTIELKGIKNIDFEELAQDSNYIFVGDFGNNYGNRKDLCIYKLSKKEIPDSENTSIRPEFIRYTYADQTSYQKKNRQHNFDCEAFCAYGDQLYLFSKNWVDAKTRMYAVPKEAGEYNLKVIAEFPVDGLITAAEYDAKSTTLALLGYKDFMPFLWLFSDFEGANFFEGKARRIDLESIHGAQTEGVCFDDSGSLLISSESSYFPQRLYALSKDIVAEKSINDLQLAEESTLNTVVYYKAKKKMILAEVRGLEKGKFQVEIVNEIWKPEADYTFKAKKEKPAKIEMDAKKMRKGLYYVRVQQDDKVKVSRVYIK